MSEHDLEIPEPLALGTEVEMRVTMGTFAGGRPWVRVQRGHVTDRVWFYGLDQWGYAVRWDGTAPGDELGAFIVQPFLEVV